MAMSETEFRWVEALAIEKIYGVEASLWIATQIGHLALRGDTNGVQRFRDIAALLDQTTSTSGAPQRAGRFANPILTSHIRRQLPHALV